jgi:uncharacterized protein DUF3558
MNFHRLWAMTLLMTIVAVLGSASCGSDQESEVPAPNRLSSRLSPRPAELSMDKVHPCLLLTSANSRVLGVGVGKPGEDTDSSRSGYCDWSNNLATPDTAYLARLYVAQPADYALDSETGHQVVTIDGFAAVQTAAGGNDPNTHCLLFVDVAQGQSLSVLYVNRRGDYPGINHEVACGLARDAAGMMVRNLRALVG